MHPRLVSQVNPRVFDLPEYDQVHVTLCWQNEGFFQRLMSNESSYPPLPSVQEALRAFIAKANWYPEDANYTASFRAKLAGYTGVEQANITLGNGSMELLDLILQTFMVRHGTDQIIIPAPDYSAYINRAKLFGWQVSQIVGGENTDEVLPTMLQAIGQPTKLILFSRPNNPVGKVTPLEDVLRLLETGVLIVVDEAYVELANPGTSVAALVSSWDNLIVLRSFSKGFGLAGLRLGYVIAHPEIIRYINMVRHIFNVNLLALIAGEALLDDLESARAVIREIVQTRDWMSAALEEVPGLRPIPSQGNFIMIDASASTRPACQYVDYLRSEGFFVRDFSRKFGLDPDRYFRVTVGQPAVMRRFVETLRAFPQPQVGSTRKEISL